MPTPRLSFCGLLIPLLTLPGCIIGGGSDEDVRGQLVSGSTLAQVQPGQSKVAHLTALLGAPESKTPQDDGSEIWRWEYRREKVSVGYLIFIFRSVNKEVSRVTTYAKIRDGVVESLWQEHG